MDNLNSDVRHSIEVRVGEVSCSWFKVFYTEESDVLNKDEKMGQEKRPRLQPPFLLNEVENFNPVFKVTLKENIQQ